MTDDNTIDTAMRIEAEVWLAVNEDGAFAVGVDEEEAASNLIDNHGANRVRTVCLTVSMTVPQVTDVAVEVPDEAGTTVSVETPADDDSTDRVVDPRQTD